MKICIATCSQFSTTPWREDFWLAQELQRQGCQTEILDWQKDTDWCSHDVIFVSSAWNIPSAPAAFERWLDACEADGKKRLINDKAILRLGYRKDHYWTLLETAGDPLLRRALTPTLFFPEQHSDTPRLLMQCHETWPKQKLVFKPIVSADSFRTYVYDPSQTAQAHDPDRRVTSAEGLADKLDEIWSDRRLGGVMAQPYLTGVEEGEISATFVGRELVGAVQKQPGFGPLPAHTRCAVNDGPTLEKLAELGRRAVDAVSAQVAMPLRSRLDVIPQEGALRILELEMVDPNCNFSTLPESERRAGVQRLANEIIAASTGRRESPVFAP